MQKEPAVEMAPLATRMFIHTKGLGWTPKQPDAMRLLLSPSPRQGTQSSCLKPGMQHSSWQGNRLTVHSAVAHRYRLNLLKY